MMELVIVTKQTHTVLLDEAVRLEKKCDRRLCSACNGPERASHLTEVLVFRIFPKHESMAETLAAEALKTYVFFSNSSA